MTLKSLYDTNEKFRTYVDAYSEKHRITAEQALLHVTVKSVAEMYLGDEPAGNFSRSESTPERRCDS